MKTKEEIFEMLASIEHDRWSDWMKYLYNMANEDVDSDYFSIPRAPFERWIKQMQTPYAELSEEDKEKDREQVRRYFDIVNGIHKTNGTPCWCNPRVEKV